MQSFATRNYLLTMMNMMTACTIFTLVGVAKVPRDANNKTSVVNCKLCLAEINFLHNYCLITAFSLFMEGWPSIKLLIESVIHLDSKFYDFMNIRSSDELSNSNSVNVKFMLFMD